MLFPLHRNKQYASQKRAKLFYPAYGFPFALNLAKEGLSLVFLLLKAMRMLALEMLPQPTLNMYRNLAKT